MEGKDESSEGDLEITRAVEKDLGQYQYLDDLTIASREQDSHGHSLAGDETDNGGLETLERALDGKARNLPQKRVDWSCEDSDPEAAYNEFKNRKTLKRKRVAAEVKKARAAAAAAAPTPSRVVGRHSAANAIVGKRPRLSGGNEGRQRKSGISKIEERSDEDELLDETLPEYLKARYLKFEKAKKKLGEAGLKLPPRFDDIYFSDDERMGDLKEKPQLPHLRPPAQYKDHIMERSAGIIPGAIVQWLRDYQVKGAEFLHEHFVYQEGGILGDDMGLGKTIQVIAFLTAAFGKTGDERDAKRMRKIRRVGGMNRFYSRVLIICPGGLMENWKAELNKWGWWQIYVFHGAPDLKEAALQAARNGRAEIVITTYTTYRLNMSAVNTVDWDCVVADECHMIKGRNTEITKAMNEINALCRIGLTGTAIQNKYEELWTLLNWTNPGRFGSLSAWKACISEPLKMGQAHDATYAQLAKARGTAQRLVNNLLPPYFIRRMKTLIADQLPKKSDRVVFCPLTETQAEAYENMVNSDIIDAIRTSSDPCPCMSGKKRGWCHYQEVEGYGKWQNYVFPSMVTLQKLSNHIALLIPKSSDSADKQDKDLENLKIVLPSQWKDLYRQRDSILNYASQEFCGKWKILKKLLQFWHANGDKVLIFSHSVRLLKMLQMLFASTTSYNVSYLDGAMSYDERASVVDSFNADPVQFVFLISTKAGGVGLNITSANKVVVVDPNWNPAYDLQAQDRAYRIGQTRDVEVFRLVSAGTIEEIVYARQIYKQQQANIGYNASSERRYFRGVQDNNDKKGEIFGLRNLFSFEAQNIVLKDIVNQTNVAEVRAGVQVIGVNVSRDDTDEGDPLRGAGDDEDAAMSQLAELVKTGADDMTDKWAKKKAALKQKSDPVQAILSSAGVQYTHENSEVIGSSKIEARLTSRALENENDIDLIGKQVFAPTNSQIALHDKVFSSDESSDGEREVTHGVWNVGWKYRPPDDVRRRQFCEMAKTFGFANATDFALVVEGWTQAQRRNCLDKFYTQRRKKIFPSESEEK